MKDKEMKKGTKGKVHGSAGKIARMVAEFLLLLLLTINCFGCFNWTCFDFMKFSLGCFGISCERVPWEDENFVYDAFGGYGVAIMDIKENAAKKETLYYPSKFRDYPIVQLGRTNCFMCTYMDCVISPENKRVYIPNTIIVISDTALSENDGAEIFLNRNRQLRLEDLHEDIFEGENEESNTIVYDVEAHDDITFNRTTLLKANVRYDRNPSAEEEYFFFIDNVKRGSKLTPPPEEPTREGYTFAGWYKEAACVHAWDFETDVTQTVLLEEGQEITYEIQQQENYVTTLYAKWTSL